jgi:uncharacterized protein (DUF2267 family)
MDYQDFITTVEELAGIPREQAGPIACSTLNILAQRISKGELEDLAPRLPEQLRTCLQREGPTATFHVDEFLHRIETQLSAGQATGGQGSTDQGSTDRATAERVATAVLAALWTTVGPKEFKDIGSELPKDFGPLLEAATLEAPPPPGGEDPRFGRSLSLDEFLSQVAERTGLDRDQARTATEAVLEVLAMRVTAGQINDLKPFLPRELYAALDRGIARSRGRALPLSLDEFLKQISQREGVSQKKEALEHVRAVMAVLRESVGQKEFQDTNAQLPREYRTW